MPQVLSELQGKSPEFLADVTKQVMTLATGVLVFTITFLEKVPREQRESVRLRRRLKRLWLCEGATILSGLVTLLMLTGQVAKSAPNIYAPNLRFISAFQLVTFGVGAVYLWLLGQELLTGQPPTAALAPPAEPPPNPTGASAAETASKAEVALPLPNQNPPP